MTQHLSYYFEPAFFEFTDGYWVDACNNVDCLEQNLISDICADRDNLDLHVRRILLNIRFKRRQQLYGSLQDLFLALGVKGVPIKRNLLEKSRDFLGNKLYAQLKQSIDENTPCHKVCRKSYHSYLR